MPVGCANHYIIALSSHTFADVIPNLFLGQLHLVSSVNSDIASNCIAHRVNTILPQLIPLPYTKSISFYLWSNPDLSTGDLFNITIIYMLSPGSTPVLHGRCKLLENSNIVAT